MLFGHVLSHLAETLCEISARSSVYEFREYRRREGRAFLVNVNGVTGASVSYSCVTFER